MAPAEVDSVIFVDIDGVLNVCIDQPDRPQMLFNLPNLERARKMREGFSGSQSDIDAMDRLLALEGEEIGQDEQGTFAKFACRRSYISSILVSRLASLIRRAGKNSSVVLASNWRRPQHAEHVRQLEAQLSKCLDRRFVFSAATEQCDEKVAADRLRCVGNYVEGLCRRCGPRSRPLRVLVVDDFFVTPLDGWYCDDTEVMKASDAESYLSGRAPNSNLQVKLLHTYAHWETAEGLELKVGCGLTERHLRQADDFLRGQSQVGVAPRLSMKPTSRRPVSDDLHAVVLQTLAHEIASIAMKRSWRTFFFPCLA